MTTYFTQQFKDILVSLAFFFFFNAVEKVALSSMLFLLGNLSFLLDTSVILSMFGGYSDFFFFLQCF